MTTHLPLVQTFKVLVVGESSVGKSSLMNRFVHGIFNTQHTATIGVDFKIAIVNIGEYKCRLQIWDTAGQERFHSITSSYYRGSDGVIIVYDVTNSASFDYVKSHISDMEHYCDKTIPMILVGNKNDATNETNKIVTTREASKYAQENQLNFFEISVKDNKNVNEVFNTISRLVLERRLQQSECLQRMSNGTRIELVDNTIPKRKCCLH
ncbi:unnamed protein product [Adineta ricciae]|uniref:Uncharacterized protein n=1 Tax=Adineta ricciae TaxID=249248 RepID=A0A813Y4J6_ADIRI|nr:unnamed protein product [Adineta ricciae]